MKRANTSRRTASASASTKRSASTRTRAAKSTSALASVASRSASTTSFAAPVATMSSARQTSVGSAGVKKTATASVAKRNLSTFSETSVSRIAPVVSNKTRQISFAMNVSAVSDISAPVSMGSAAVAPLKLKVAAPLARAFATSAIAPFKANLSTPQRKQVVDMLTRSFTTGDFGDDAADGMRERGTVKWFDTAKGYGFITRDSGADIFVHFSALPEIRPDGASRPLLRTLHEGQVVEFAVGSTAKGPCAVDCVPLVQDQ